MLFRSLVEDLAPLIESPLEKLFLPGSPIRSIEPLTFCPLKHLNIIGLKLNDLSPLLEMRLDSLFISPLELSQEGFSILQQLNLKSLVGPGDSDQQSIEEFIVKYNHSAPELQG